jgi:hypothetical protein
MASLVLGAVGYAVGGPLGGLIGSAIGGFIDRQIFATNTTVEGQRVEDLSVSISSYGAAIPRVWGPENRINGNIIWSTGLRETEQREKQSAGGKGGGSSVTNVTYTYDASVAILICRGPIGGIGRIWADSKLIADFRDQLPTMADPAYAWPFVGTSSEIVLEDGTVDEGARFNSITIYNGNATQTPNSIMEAVEGAGNVPGYRGSAYVVFDTLQLADFGNRIPNLTFEVMGEWSATTGTVLAELAERSGLGPYINTRALTDNVRGLSDVSSGSAQDAANALLGMYDVDISEIGDKLYFLPKDRTPLCRVPSRYLGAFTEGGEPPPQRIAVLANEIDMPNAVEVVHRDPDRDYLANTQRARRTTKKSQGNISVRSEIVMPASQARFIAEDKLRRAWATRKSFNFTLPINYQQLVAGDSVVIEDRFGNEFSVRILNIRKSGLTLEIEGVALYARFQRFREATSVPVRSIVSVGSSAVEYALLDLPPLRDTDNASGIYIAAGAFYQTWRGASLLASNDGGASYEQVATFPGNAIIGELTTAMAVGPTLYFDTQTFDVQLVSPNFQLESATLAQLLNGANALAINGEIVQFQTATLVGNATYQLSGILRGRRGTEHRVAAHPIGTEVVLLTGGAIGRIPIDLPEVGVVRQFKAVPSGIDPADITGEDFTYNANVLRPFSPVHVRARRDPTTGDWNATWIRRTRINGGWTDGVDVPLGENTEAYEVDILDGTTVKRTVTGLTSPSLTYTSAEQTSDFGSPQTTLKIAVYQMSDLVGRGHGSIEEFT